MGSPFISVHNYWEKKQQFQLKEDLYDQWVVFAIEHGEFRYEIDKHIGSASFGDLVFCPPHTAFRRETITPLTFHFIQFTNEHHEFPIGKLSVNDTTRLLANYQYLRKLALFNDSQSMELKNHYVLDILYTSKLEKMENQSQVITSSNDPLINQAALIIQKQAWETISLKTLALSLGLSPVQLTRRFQNAFQVTPSQFLKSIRMKRAQHLLTETNLTLDQIAKRCGYENGFYLSRVFTQSERMSPSLYRRTHQV